MYISFDKGDIQIRRVLSNLSDNNCDVIQKDDLEKV